MLGTPFIPDQITVHLGRPDEDAPNVSVSFPAYVKNVASSELYPTWPESSLRANIYVIVTYALNRIYTEWYRSRGYNFDITNTTQFDQAYVEGRNIFENVSVLTDELFNDYISRQGSVEPYFTSFCNGTTTTCAGLSQWGTVGLAEQGYVPYQILQYYYGDDIDIVFDAPVQTNTPSYPGTPLQENNASNSVKAIQIQLNRISSNYPQIPKIPNVNGFFGTETLDAVEEFQQIFNLPVTGIVDKATWYKIAYIFVSVKKLAELNSEGLGLSETVNIGSEILSPGMEGDIVLTLQYYLAVIGAYYQRVLPVTITGNYDEQTRQSVISFQNVFGLDPTGLVNEQTWNDIYRTYIGIVESVPVNVSGVVALYPGTELREGQTSEYIRLLQEYLTLISQSYPEIPSVNNTGYFGPVTRSSVIAFQQLRGLPQTGVVNAETWNQIGSLYSDLRFGQQKQAYQYPGYVIK